MGTLAADKNEILFSEFGINYNNEAEVYRKGTVLVQNPRTRKHTKREPTVAKGNADGTHHQSKDGQNVSELNCDIIGDQFWTEHPHVLLGNPIPILPKAPRSHSSKEIELTI